MKRMLSALLACALLLPSAAAPASGVSVRYAPAEGELINPFIGNAAWAENDEEREQPFTLVYANLTWAELEPQEGAFDFEAFEERCHFDKWREEGKRLILRFVMDMPSGKKHTDLPDWLMERVEGSYYTVPYGRGFCPDYANEALIAAHRRVIRALGERYDGDSFVAFVQLGSLGHWGEWHVHDDAGEMPPEAVRDRYAQAYSLAFPNTFLMMRRPFRYAGENGLGLYNDTAGQPEPTREWLDWIFNGGAYGVEEGALTAMPNAWQTSPIGGELSTSMEKKDFLADGLKETIALFQASHASWIGPGSFVDVERGGELQAPLDRLMASIGYRLRISQARIDMKNDGFVLTLQWENDGCAPFYFNWQPSLRLTDAGGGQRVIPLAMELSAVLPGKPVTVETFLPNTACRIELGILDPDTAEPGVLLAMSVERDGKWYQLFDWVQP